METLNKNQLYGIARLLVDEHMLSPADAWRLQHLALDNKMSLPKYVVQLNILSAHAIAQTIAQHLQLPFIDLALIDVSLMPKSLLNNPFFKSNDLIPISLHNLQLCVATDDPYHQVSLKEIEFHTGLKTDFVVVETDKLHALLTEISCQEEQHRLTDYFEKTQQLSDSTQPIEHTIPSLSLPSNHDERSIINLVNQILLEASKRGASDIHLEPYNDSYRIRLRQDGQLVVLATPSKSLYIRIIARIKIMSELDISERRLPQDGRFHFTSLNKSPIHVRVSTCPTVSGEKIVIRLLDPLIATTDLEALGFTPSQVSCFQQAISRPQGMILVTGPTGCGKTMTLYSALKILNTEDKNICAVEDPVELQVHGINQVNVHLKADLSFSKVLRSFLRQDPDIIMIGEIRDLETADIAIKSALTGHLVLSTLHTNSAIETLTRLSNMGIATFNLASAVSLIIAQRLVRRLCEICKTPRTDLSTSCLTTLGFNSKSASGVTTYQANGCKFCHKGYMGRIGLYEMLPISKSIAQLILSGRHANEIQQQAEFEGMQTIYKAGLLQVALGQTTLEEINRITIE